jgi:hypothetical protein
VIRLAIKNIMLISLMIFNFTWIYLFHQKFKVFQFFKEFQCLVECMFDRKIIAMQADWVWGGGGGECERFNSFFAPLEFHI